MNAIPPNLTGETLIIEIDKANVAECMEFLIKAHIPFKVEYKGTSATESPLEIASLMSDADPALTPRKKEKRLKEAQLVENIYRQYISDTDFSTSANIKDIVKEYSISLLNFQQIFKTVYGKSFYQLYIDKKMDYAADLLRKGHKAKEIAKMIGYGDKSSIKFNKMFQKHFGLTPKKFQMEARAASWDWGWNPTWGVLFASWLKETFPWKKSISF